MSTLHPELQALIAQTKATMRAEEEERVRHETEQDQAEIQLARDEWAKIVQVAQGNLHPAALPYIDLTVPDEFHSWTNRASLYIRVGDLVPIWVAFSRNSSRDPWEINHAKDWIYACSNYKIETNDDGEDSVEAGNTYTSKDFARVLVDAEQETTHVAELNEQAQRTNAERKEEILVQAFVDYLKPIIREVMEDTNE